MNEVRGALPEELESMAPGPELAALLASVDRRALSGTDRVRLARARNRLVAHMQGELFADLHSATFDEAPDEEALGRHPDASRYPWAEIEIAFALTWTRRAAGIRLEQARLLVEDLPRLLHALRAGELDVPKVLVICELVGRLDPAAARQVVDRVLGKARELTTGQLRARLRKLVQAVEPQEARLRCAAAVAQREVALLDNSNGSAELWGRSLPPQDATAAWERLTAIARATKAAGDARTIDQLRADALLDLLVGEGIAAGEPLRHHDVGLAGFAPDPAPAAPAPPAPAEVAASGPRAALPGPRRGVVELQVPLTALMSLTQLPGELNGFGPVVADIARQVAEQHRDGTWRFSVYSEIGQLLSHGITRARPDRLAEPRTAHEHRGDRHGSRRRPTAEVAAFVRARNRTCVAPGCRVPATSCDLDHVIDWARGGSSDSANLAPKCRLHHRFKHESGARVMAVAPGVVGWQTPRGLQYVSSPDPPLLDDELINLGPPG